MEFSPNNKIVQFCIQGMAHNDQGNPQDAERVFMQAWSEASNDFEKFFAAYFIARNQKNISDKLRWFETALAAALQTNNFSIETALPGLYTKVGECYEELGDYVLAKKNHTLSITFKSRLSDPGPFYHGTKADLHVGDLLTAGRRSNYQSDIIMNHIYFTALVDGAGLAAALAKGDGPDRVYLVEPTGSFENDPNVTDKKFPGNPSRSYRTEFPLRITGEVSDWIRQTPADLQKWKEKLARNKGKIIN